MLTLEDIFNLPNNPTDEHKTAVGLLKPPPPVVPPVAPTIPSVSPVTPRPPVDWKAKIAATAPKPGVTVPEMAPVDPGASGTPNFGTGIPEDTSGVQAAATGKIPELPKLGFKERQALPLTSEGVEPNSPGYFRAQQERMIDQQNNPWGGEENHHGLLGKIGHVAAKIGNIAGNIVAPGTMSLIPGTELNKQEQMREAEGRESKATAAEESAKNDAARRSLEGAQEEEARARAEKLGAEGQADIVQDPAGNAVGWKGPDGNYHSFDDAETPPGLKAISEKWQAKAAAKPVRENVEQGLAGAIQDAIESGRDPETDKAVEFWEKEKEKITNQKESKASEEDKAISDYLSGHNIPDTPKNRDRARSVLKTRDRTSADEETRELKKELLRAQVAKSQEPTADEQRRADLGNNMMENLGELEAIVDKHPGLFGPVAGRITGARAYMGTDNKDIARLSAIKEYLGMASVGAHAMRNAQHVETAADAVMNSLHNSPGATKAAIEQARKSVQTFLDDANRRRNAVEKEKEQAGGGGGTAGGGKVASSELIDAYAKAHNVTRQQAEDAARKSGYEIRK